MANLNVKTLIIDTDNVSIVSSINNPTRTYLSFVRGNEYVLQANCYASSTSNVAATFEGSDDFAVYIGADYGSAADPVIAITDPNKFNNVADWSLSNVLSGNLSVRVNVSGAALDADLGNAASSQYTLQLIATNSESESVVITSTPTTIYNSIPQ